MMHPEDLMTMIKTANLYAMITDDDARLIKSVTLTSPVGSITCRHNINEDITDFMSRVDTHLNHVLTDMQLLADPEIKYPVPVISNITIEDASDFYPEVLPVRGGPHPGIRKSLVAQIEHVSADDLKAAEDAAKVM